MHVFLGDGTLWAWGDNKRLQLGIDTGGETKQPTPTQGSIDIVEVLV